MSKHCYSLSIRRRHLLGPSSWLWKLCRWFVCSSSIMYNYSPLMLIYQSFREKKILFWHIFNHFSFILQNYFPVHKRHNPVPPLSVPVSPSAWSPIILNGPRLPTSRDQTSAWVRRGHSPCCAACKNQAELWHDMYLQSNVSNKDWRLLLVRDHRNYW